MPTYSVSARDNLFVLRSDRRKMTVGSVPELVRLVLLFKGPEVTFDISSLAGEMQVQIRTTTESLLENNEPRPDFKSGGPRISAHNLLAELRNSAYLVGHPGTPPEVRRQMDYRCDEIRALLLPLLPSGLDLPEHLRQIADPT